MHNLTPLNKKILKDAVDGFYNKLEESGQRVNLCDYSKFKIDGRGVLRLLLHPDIDLFDKRKRTPLALSTLVGRLGVNFIRDKLGFIDYNSTKPVLRPEASKALKDVEETALKTVGDTLVDAYEVKTRLRDALETLNDPPLNNEELVQRVRELIGLDKAMRRLKSEHQHNTTKLSEIDKHIDLEERKLTEIATDPEGQRQADDDEHRKIILRRLRNLKDKRSVCLEAASITDKALH